MVLPSVSTFAEMSAPLSSHIKRVYGPPVKKQQIFLAHRDSLYYFSHVNEACEVAVICAGYSDNISLSSVLYSSSVQSMLDVLSSRSLQANALVCFHADLRFCC